VKERELQAHQRKSAAENSSKKENQENTVKLTEGVKE
jgi:hypothetical protein